MIYLIKYDILFILYQEDLTLDKQKNTKFQKIFSGTIILITAIITLFIGLLAIGKTAFFNTVINFASEKTDIKIDNILLNILFTFFTLGILYFIYITVLPKISKKILFILMLVFTLSLGFWWVNYLKLKPISDQSMVVYCAEKILDNDLCSILDPGNYLSRNPHQLGFVLYIAIIFKIFNTRNVIFLQNIAVIFSTLSAITMYFIVKELFEEEIVHKLSLLFISFFSIYFVFFCPHVYGNLPGLSFGLIAILFTLKFINSNKFWHLIIVAFSITISYLLKNNYEIFLIAIIIELALKILSEIKTFKIKPINNFFKNNIFKSFSGIIIIVSIVFGIKTLVYTCFENYTNYYLQNGVPVISYIYMGIAEPVTLTPGWYTGDVEIIYNESGYNKEKSSEKTKKLLEKRIEYLSQNSDYTFNYFKSKIETTWLNPTFQTIWCSTPSLILDLDPAYNNYIAPKKILISILTGKAFYIEEQIMDIYQILMFLISSFALIRNFKEGSLKKMFLPLIFLGGFSFHLLWETKSIYVLQYFYLLIPYSVYGIYNIFSLILKKIGNEKQRL